MRLPLLLFCTIISCGISSYAQQRNIVVDSVRNFGGFNQPEEPCIAMDPKNPAHLVGGANLYLCYSSMDSGYTWRKDTLQSSGEVEGDPVTIVDTLGSFYYFHLGGDGDHAITCQKLDNIGAHAWTDGTYPGVVGTPANEDKPWATVDRRNNKVYVTWTQYAGGFGSTNPLDSTEIYFAASGDTGNDWSTPVRISNMGGDCSNRSTSVEGAMPCVGPNGEIYVAWAHDDAILFNRSFDGGATWLANETEVSNSPGGWYYTEVAGVFRDPGLPFIAADNSDGPYRGNVYINWDDPRNGNTDVWLLRSADCGATWGSPVKVNDDTTHREHFMSSMAVDAVTGYIYIVFYDRRNHTDSATDVYLAVSRDGAVTFQNYLVSDTPFTPARSVFFGDYTGIVANNNIVRPIWAVLETISPGEYDSKIMTAIIDSTITGIATVQPVMPQGYSFRAYPNPFTDHATIFYELPVAEIISLYLIDITGRKVATIRDNEQVQQGRHFEQLDAAQYGLRPGVYFLRMSSGGFSQVVKMVKVE